MKRFLVSFALALFASALIVPVALGQAAAPPPDTTVAIPWGDWLASAASTIALVLSALVVWGFRQLPSQLVGVLKTLRADQLLHRAIDYGVNTVAGAARGRVMTVDVANEVVAQAMRYAVENGASSIISWLGGETAVRDRIVARLQVEPGASL